MSVSAAAAAVRPTGDVNAKLDPEYQKRPKKRDKFRNVRFIEKSIIFIETSLLLNGTDSHFWQPRHNVSGGR